MRIFHISHNAETEMKKKISTMELWPNSQSLEYIAYLHRLEREVLNSSEWTFACSEEDRDSHLEQGAQNCHVIPNAGKLRIPSKNAAKNVSNILGTEKYVLFVASGHPPNVHGFLHGIGIDFGFIPTGAKLLLVGSSVKYILPKILKSKFKETFLVRGASLEYASDTLLADLYSQAAAVVLPIYEGGGSNIKTAEAFLNAQNVLTTSFALRGYDERLWKEKKYTTVNSPEEFKKAMQGAITAYTDKIVPNECEVFTWEWVSNEHQATVEKLVLKLGI
jgi:hypothetical protein